MATYFVIRIGETADEPVSWIAVDDHGTRREAPGSGSLEDAARQVRERPVIVLVPGIDVITLNAEVPARGARLLAALPYALEDQLAEDVEELHFAAGQRREDGTTPVAVVATDKVTGWIDRLAAAGIVPAKVVPENHGLAFTPNTLSMLVSGDDVMFNDGDKTEFMVPGLRPGEALAATGIIGSDEEEDASKHLLVYCDAPVADEYEKDWALLRHELESVDVHLLSDGVLPRLAVTIASGAGINLLQGQFGERTDFRAAFQPWRFAAMFLIGLLIVGVGGKAADYYSLSVEQAELKEQFADVYQQLRPGASREIIDPVRIVQSFGDRGPVVAEGPQVFLPSLEQLALALQQTDTVDVEVISYRAGVVDVRLNAPDVTTLDRIVQAVGASGQFTASLLSADSVGDRVNSRIQIREEGA